MTKFTMPYNLTEGTVAYAAKVMANFNAFRNKLNSVNITGLTAGDLDSVLAQLLALMVKIGEDGNADDIVFEDGDTLQEKYDVGGTSLGVMTAAGGFYFNVDEDGYLHVTGNDNLEAADFVLDTDTESATYGHLIYTLHDPETDTDIHTYDLGNVRGPQGEAGTGDMDAADYDPNALAKDLNTYTEYVTAYSASWDESNEQEITCSGMTADSTFEIGPSQLTSIKTERDAWRAAQVCISAQGTDSITLLCDGTVPSVDIPLQVSFKA